MSQNQTEALAYCSKLGMQLAEIQSESQFLALDKADVEEWRDNWGNIHINLYNAIAINKNIPNVLAAWTAGMEITGIHRYIWNNSNTVLDSNLPYRFMNEEARYGVLFRKRNDGSHLFNSPLTALQGTLCETLT